MKILFGHQSVGANILEGLITLSGAPRVTPLEQQHHDPAHAGDSIIHFRVGRNHDAASKLAHFERVLANATKLECDLALLKFCYVDVVDERGASSALEAYVRTMDALQSRLPRTLIGHSTIPLRAIPSKWRRRIRRVLGRPEPPELRRNAMRHEFNEHMSERYAASGLLFDLAACEAAPVGRSHADNCRPGDAPALAARYTDDGGHLNALGRTVVAGAFLSYLRSALGLRPRQSR